MYPHPRRRCWTRISPFCSRSLQSKCFFNKIRDTIPRFCLNDFVIFWKAAQVPVEFEMFFLSEIQHTLSAPLEDVAASISRNGICLKVSGRYLMKFFSRKKRGCKGQFSSETQKWYVCRGGNNTLFSDLLNAFLFKRENAGIWILWKCLASKNWSLADMFSTANNSLNDYFCSLIFNNLICILKLRLWINYGDGICT